ADLQATSRTENRCNAFPRASPRRHPLFPPLYPVCSPGHKGHDDSTSSPPSSGLSPAVTLECPTECWQLILRVPLVTGLTPTSHDTSCRQPCTTCHFCPRRESSISRAGKRMSRPGKVLRVASH